MTEKPSIEDVRALEQFIARDGATKHLLTFQGILRSHEEMHAALSTPPADDVREALAVEAAARAIFSGYVGETPGGFEKQTYAYDRKKAEHVARRALAAAAEVRPHGTVTDAEAKELTTIHAIAQATGMSVESAFDALAAIRKAAREVHP